MAMMHSNASMSDSSTTDRPLPEASRGREVLHSLGLLALRLGFGLNLALLHGFSKLTHFSEISAKFFDPFHIGASASLGLVVFAEFFCALLIVAGFLTRLAAIPLIINMFVAGVIFHHADPWATKELALLYLTVFVTLLLAGGGKFSVDGLIRSARSKRRLGAGLSP